MKERIVVGVLLVGAVLVIGLINNPYLIRLVLAFISILAIYEAKKLFEIDEQYVDYALYTLSILSVVVPPILVAVVGVLVLASYVAYYQKELKIVALALYPFVPVMLISELYLKTSIEILAILILIVALTDSMAYFVGKSFGRKFIESGFCKTSPKKSWEGVIGGVGIATIVGSVALGFFYNFFIAFSVALLVSVASVFGDLFESFLKRRAGVKDSGNILPGHGGVLDRVDGYLFAAPLMLFLIGIR